MKKVFVLITCGLLLACTDQADKVSDVLPTKANAVIADIEADDGAEVARCLADVAACDTSADATCEIAEVMDEQCAELKTDLEDVREPVVGCWRGVAECEKHAGDHCKAAAEACDRQDDGRHHSRQPIVDCAKITEECLSEAAAAGDDASACDAVIAHCEKVSELAVDAEHSRFRGDDDGEEKCDHAKDMADEGKDFRSWVEEKKKGGDDDKDEDGDDDDDDDDTKSVVSDASQDHEDHVADSHGDENADEDDATIDKDENEDEDGARPGRDNNDMEEDNDNDVRDSDDDDDVDVDGADINA